MRRTVAAVYTAQAIVEPVSALFQEILPEVRLVNIVDGGLIQDVIRDGQVTTATARRLLHCYMGAVEAGAELILNTCSSVGDLVAHAQWFVPIPVLKIDGSMAAAAVRQAARVGVLATLGTTLAPTVRLVQAEAVVAGREVQVIEGLAEGAFQALTSGRPEEHDELLLEAARRLAGKVDLFVLAQGSMARMEGALAEATGKPVLSSPRSGVEAVREALAGRK